MKSAFDHESVALLRGDIKFGTKPFIDIEIPGTTPARQRLRLGQTLWGDHRRLWLKAVNIAADDACCRGHPGCCERKVGPGPL